MIQGILTVLRTSLDLFILFVTCLIVFVISAQLDAFERFVQWSRQYEQWQLDEMGAVAAMLLIALGIFSWRGWWSLGQEVKQRRQTEQELRQRNQELSTLYTVALASTQDPSPLSIQNNTLAELTRALNMPFGLIHLRRGQKFILQSYRGYTEEEAHRLRELELDQYPWLAEVKLVREPLDQPPDQIEAWEKALGIQTWISVPMRAKNELVGVIRLACQVEYHCTPARISLITGVANQNALVLEQKTLEQQLLHSQKMESIGRLAGGVAHDFNNLLTAITGYASLSLELIPPNDPTSDFIREIQKSADRATNLNKQLLAFARRQMIEPKVIDLNELIVDMTKMLGRLISEDIQLVTLPSSEVCTVKVDPGQIGQVLVNLAVNARDAMPRGGKLTIETDNLTIDEGYAHSRPNLSPGPYVMLAVSDNGTGMTEEVKAHLFEPFFTTKEKGKGTGLGLATCYGIVKHNGGHIWVYSELGQGTTFKIYFPRVADEPVHLSPEAAPVLRGGTETILLVEDEASVRELAVHILRQQGYTVLEASNGEEALQLAQQRLPEEIHLLLSDVVMPQMGGRELADKLRELRPDVKVLFTSGYTDDAIIQHGVLKAGLAFLQKPFSPVVLARKVREVLDN